jgi:hypothetical protein
VYVTTWLSRFSSQRRCFESAALRFQVLRFHRTCPMYSGLFKMPVPRLRSPWMAVLTQPRVRFACSRCEVRFQAAPGDGAPSSFSCAAIHLADFPSAYQVKMRRTVSACSAWISRWPLGESLAAM